MCVDEAHTYARAPVCACVYSACECARVMCACVVWHGHMCTRGLPHLESPLLLTQLHFCCQSVSLSCLTFIYTMSWMVLRAVLL